MSSRSGSTDAEPGSTAEPERRGIVGRPLSHEQVPLCEEALREHGVVVAASVDEGSKAGRQWRGTLPVR